MAKFTKNKSAQPDLRDLLLSAGVGQYTAVMSIPYMNFLPGACDPYAQGVMQIVEGLQVLLNKRGERLAVDGGLGNRTLRALIKYAGPRWYDKSWSQLYGDVLSGKRWQGPEREDRGPPEAMAEWSYANAELGSSVVGDFFASPLPWIGAAAIVYFKWLR